MPQTITRQSFDARNAEGELGEQAIKQAFESCSFTVDARHAFHKRDLFVQSRNCKAFVEVKNETKFANKVVGTACIELFQGSTSHHSGLMISQATHCVHWFGDEVFAYECQPMRNWLQEQIRKGNYKMQHFGKADNSNGGVIVQRGHAFLSNPEFVFDGPIAELPKCRLFNSDYQTE